MAVRINFIVVLHGPHRLVATDSGANVRRCCLDLTETEKINWVPCILHGLHNSSKYALGLVDEDIADDNELVRDVLLTEEELFGAARDDL